MSTKSDDIDADIENEFNEMFGDLLKQSEKRSGVGFDDLLLESMFRMAFEIIMLKKSQRLLIEVISDRPVVRPGSAEIGSQLILNKLQENGIILNQRLHTMGEKISAIERSVNSIEYRIGRH